MTVLVVGFFAWQLWRFSRTLPVSAAQLHRRQAQWVLLLLLLQFCLGVLNIWWLLPLPNAVAHNFVAANLLAATVLARYGLRQQCHAPVAGTAPQYLSSGRSPA
jgi:cytochrome c oxidase assembly protein subunit 15